MSSNPSELTPDDYKHLAIQVLTWRLRRGLSQKTVAERGGPSDTTLSAIEAAEWRSARPHSTLAKLDAGMRWSPGISERILFQGLDVVAETSRFEDPDDVQPDNLMRLTAEQNREVANLRNRIVHRQRTDFVFGPETPEVELVERMERLTQDLVHIDNLLYPLQFERVMLEQELNRVATEVNTRRNESSIDLFAKGSLGGALVDVPAGLGDPPGEPTEAEIAADVAEEEAFNRHMAEQEAARQTGRPSRGQQRRTGAAGAGEPETDDPTDVEPR